MQNMAVKITRAV